MLKPGIYRYRHEFYGDILLKVKETKSSFILELMKQQIRYDAPQIDDMFRRSPRVVISKRGSKHAMGFIPGCDDWFCLYPYRVGVPYAFQYIMQKEEYKDEQGI